MIEINLLPLSEYRRSDSFEMLRWIYILIPAITCVFLFILHYYFVYQSRLIDKNIKNLEIQLAHKIKTPIMIPNADDAIIIDKMQRQSIAVAILNKLFHSSVDGLNVQSINQKDEAMLIQGQSVSMSNIHELMSILLTVKKVRAIKLDWIKRREQRFQFQISIIEMEES